MVWVEPGTLCHIPHRDSTFRRRAPTVRPFLTDVRVVPGGAARVWRYGWRVGACAVSRAGGTWSCFRGPGVGGRGGAGRGGVPSERLGPRVCGRVGALRLGRYFVGRDKGPGRRWTEVRGPPGKRRSGRNKRSFQSFWTRAGKEPTSLTPGPTLPAGPVTSAGGSPLETLLELLTPDLYPTLPFSLSVALDLFIGVCNRQD